MKTVNEYGKEFRLLEIGDKIIVEYDENGKKNYRIDEVVNKAGRIYLECKSGAMVMARSDGKCWLVKPDSIAHRNRAFINKDELVAEVNDSLLRERAIEFLTANFGCNIWSMPSDKFSKLATVLELELSENEKLTVAKLELQ